MRLGALICALTRRRLPGLAARAAADGETAPPRHVRQCLDCKQEWATLVEPGAGVMGRPRAAADTELAAGGSSRRCRRKRRRCHRHSMARQRSGGCSLLLRWRSCRRCS